MSAVVLSRGSAWNPGPYEPPYLQAESGPFPDGANAWVVFYDTAGITLNQIDLPVTPLAILPDAEPEEVDGIPAGTNFEIFLDAGGRTKQIRHGKVMRREAQFTTSPAVTTSVQALQFTDTFPTLGLRSSWQPVFGRTKVWDNSGESLPNGVGSEYDLLLQEQGAIRWFQPLNGDSARVKVNLLNQNGAIGATTGKATVIVCADQRFTSYLGVQFVENGHKIHFCKGSGPVTVTYQGSEITNTVADNDSYEIAYDNASDTIYVYKGASTSPLGSWNDSTHSVPHGPGHRYLGLAWDNTLLNPGIQVSYWSAKDDV